MSLDAVRLLTSDTPAAERSSGQTTKLHYEHITQRGKIRYNLSTVATKHNLKHVTVTAQSETILLFIFFWLCSPAQAMASSSTGFLDHTQWRATVGKTPLNEWSARRRDLYLTTHATYKHPCPRWDSKPRLQKTSGRRTTAYTARPLGTAEWNNITL
jgi:hypothetical protein